MASMSEIRTDMLQMLCCCFGESIWTDGLIETTPMLDTVLDPTKSAGCLPCKALEHIRKVRGCVGDGRSGLLRHMPGRPPKWRLLVRENVDS